jgi:hypothetical protein
MYDESDHEIASGINKYLVNFQMTLMKYSFTIAVQVKTIIFM